MKAGMTIARTVDRLLIVAEMEAQGRTLMETAERLGVTERTVSRLRERHRGYQKDYAKPLTDEQVAAYTALLDEGWSYAEIARTYHVTQLTLARRIPGRAWDRSEVGRFAAAGRLMNAIPDLCEPASRENFASLKVTQFKKPRGWHAAGAHTHDLRQVG
jgi:hypothetical protein